MICGELGQAANNAQETAPTKPPNLLALLMPFRQRRWLLFLHPGLRNRGRGFLNISSKTATSAPGGQLSEAYSRSSARQHSDMASTTEDRKGIRNPIHNPFPASLTSENLLYLMEKQTSLTMPRRMQESQPNSGFLHQPNIRTLISRWRNLSQSHPKCKGSTDIPNLFSKIS